MMGDGGVKQMLAKPILLADQVTKWADEAQYFRQECLEVKTKTERLASLLRQAARADLYERPARRIMVDTEQVLDKAFALVSKCRAGGLVKRIFTIIPAGSFKKMLTFLDNSIGDVSWLLRVSTASGDEDGDAHLGLPPIAQNEPILFLIWEQIATLQTGSLETRGDAAASLVSLARDNDRYGKLIIEEDGVGPLLRLVKEGRLEGQENAALAIGLLARDADSVEQMMQAGVCVVFAKVLKDGAMKVQAMVAWAISELANAYPKCQDMFAQNNVIRLLVGHIAFETVQEHSKYSITSKISIHSVVMDNKNNPKPNSAHRSEMPPDLIDTSDPSIIKHPNHGKQPHPQNKNQMHNLVEHTMNSKSVEHTMNSKSVKAVGLNGSISTAGFKAREFEDPETKAYMKAMAARALWFLAKGNHAICKSITESKALLCFAVLLEKQTGDVQYNSAMALMEICRVAEDDADLRRSAFKPTSPAARAVVDQLLRVVEKADYDDLLIPCITSLGCLSRTFRATETRIIGPLVKLLDEREGEVSREAVIALTKFACSENFLHLDHCKAIIAAGGARHLVQLVYFAEQVVQIDALILLCYIALHVPDSEALAQAEILTVLEWSSKQGYMIQHPTVEELLPEAKVRLELYQSRGTKNYH